MAGGVVYQRTRSSATSSSERLWATVSILSALKWGSRPAACEMQGLPRA